MLAASYPRTLPRDKLLACLWPERDTEHARNLLSQAVYAVRKALGEEAILAAGDELRFNPEVVGCDVVSFEQAIAAGDRARAVGLYAGPFVDGFFLREAPDFEQWAESERERYRRAYGLALEGLAETAAAEKDFAPAVEWWRRCVAEEPYNARVTLRLMEALELAGDRAGALQQARIHAVLLAEEFEAEPDPQLEAFAERLRTSPAHRATEDSAQAEEEGNGPGQPVPNAEVRERPAAAPPAAAGAIPEAQPEGPPARAPRSPRRRLARRVVLPFAAIVGVAAALAVGWLLVEASARPDTATDAAANSPKTIAVLPFVNSSRDPQEEYFSDGLTEELISVLSQVRALGVVSRTSSFAFKGKDQDIREIGEALNVSTVLEGSVRKVGDRVRVAAQLINAADGFHLWAETYEREGTDVFAIQSDLALRIVGALKAELTPAERARLARRPTESAEAHALYLKGRYFWYQRSSGGFARAIDYFERAIEADSQYARAYAGLATVYLLQGISGELAPQEAGERTRAAALNALELDDELAEAHAALGAYFEAYAWNAAAAEREWRRAIELDPNYPTVRHFYGNLLTAMGRFDEAIAQKRKAVELDPLSPVFSEVLGHTLRRAGRLEEAVEALRNAIELDSTYWRAYGELGAVYEMMGRPDEAVRAHRRAVDLAGADANVDAKFARIGLARTLALAGRKDDARRMLAEMHAEAERTEFHRPHGATVFLALDDVEGAIDWLERSYHERNPHLGARALDVLRDPLFAPIQDDPRFLDLRRRLGLPR
jgi:serine/threonine-protein kinase